VGSYAVKAFAMDVIIRPRKGALKCYAEEGCDGPKEDDKTGEADNG
jgi:hypothetical protein